MNQSATKRRLADETIRVLTSRCLGRTPEQIRELTDGFFNAAYLLTFPGGEKAVMKAAPPKDALVLRQERGLLETEVEIMRLAGRRTTLPIPEILGYLPAGEELDAGCFWMSFLPGVTFDKLADSWTQPQIDKLYEQLGRMMRELHQIDGSYFGRPGCTHETWAAAFHEMIEDVLLDAADAHVPLPLPPETILDLTAKAAPLLNEVKRPQLLHKDLWFGNIFVGEQGEISGLIDWERAIYGDPLFEFLFAYLAGDFDFPARGAFYRGYQRSPHFTPAENGRIVLYDIYYSLLILVEGVVRGYETPEVREQGQKRLVKGVQSAGKLIKEAGR